MSGICNDDAESEVKTSPNNASGLPEDENTKYNDIPLVIHLERNLIHNTNFNYFQALSREVGPYHNE